MCEPMSGDRHVTSAARDWTAHCSVQMEREVRKRIASLVGGSVEQLADDNVTVESLQDEGLLQMVPKEYQVQGIRWLLQCHSNGHGCILGDDMGLGKTLQVCKIQVTPTQDVIDLNSSIGHQKIKVHSGVGFR